MKADPQLTNYDSVQKFQKVNRSTSVLFSRLFSLHRNITTCNVQHGSCISGDNCSKCQCTFPGVWTLWITQKTTWLPISNELSCFQKAAFCIIHSDLVFLLIMHRFSTACLSLLFLTTYSAQAYIVAPESITVQHLATLPLVTVGSGISVSIPDTITSYVIEPTNMFIQTIPSFIHRHAHNVHYLTLSLSQCGVSL